MGVIALRSVRFWDFTFPQADTPVKGRLRTASSRFP